MLNNRCLKIQMSLGSDMFKVNDNVGGYNCFMQEYFQFPCGSRPGSSMG